MIKRRIRNEELKILLNEELYHKYNMMNFMYIFKIAFTLLILSIIIITLVASEILDNIFFMYYLIVSIGYFSIKSFNFCIYNCSAKKEYDCDEIVKYLNKNYKKITIDVSISDILDKNIIRLEINNKDYYTCLDYEELEKVKQERKIVLNCNYGIKDEKVYVIYTTIDGVKGE